MPDPAPTADQGGAAPPQGGAAPPQGGAAPPQAGAGNWLILSDRGGVGNAVAAALAARGLCCTVVAAGAQQTAITEHLKAKTRWQAVVYLWGLDAIATDSPAQVGDVTHRATAPMLALMQAETRSSKPPRLWIVTRGACVVVAAGAEVVESAICVRPLDV